MTKSAQDGLAGLDREIVLDIFRLSTRLVRATPNGIDRVDASFATHFLASDAPNRKAFLLTPIGPRAIRLSAARSIVEGVHTRWRESERPETDRAFLRVRSALAGGQPSPPNLSLPGESAPRRLAQTMGVLSGAALLHASAWTQMDAIGTGAVYLNVCQFPLYIPSYFRWLRKRPDVRPVFMIHDLLPIKYPEFFRPAEFQRHTRRLSVLADIAAGVIVSTQAVSEALLTHFEALGRRPIPLLVEPLPVAPIFHEPREHDEGLAAQPYFIICGTIEPRKNHMLLLNLWRELGRSLGPATPKLIVAGARGWENENILDMLERCPEIRDHVIEAPGLSTPSLKRLMDNARAVLMPSFAEGYGLPAVEALAAGVPVLASDLPSLRMLCQPGMTLLDPLDGPAWLAAIRRLSQTPPSRLQDRRYRASSSFSSKTYFERIEAFLATV